MDEGFPHHAVERGQPHKCVLQSPESRPLRWDSEFGKRLTGDEQALARHPCGPHPPTPPTANGCAPNMSGNPEPPRKRLGVLAFALTFPQPSLFGA